MDGIGKNCIPILVFIRELSRKKHIIEELKDKTKENPLPRNLYLEARIEAQW